MLATDIEINDSSIKVDETARGIIDSHSYRKVMMARTMKILILHLQRELVNAKAEEITLQLGSLIELIRIYFPITL